MTYDTSGVAVVITRVLFPLSITSTRHSHDRQLVALSERSGTAADRLPDRKLAFPREIELSATKGSVYEDPQHEEGVAVGQLAAWPEHSAGVLDEASSNIFSSAGR